MTMPFARLQARLAFSGRARERCWKKLGRQLEATRLPLERCFALLLERAREDRSSQAIVYADIMDALAQGESVARAIAPWAGPEEIMLVDAGQTAGEKGLPQGFLRAVEYLARSRQVRSQVFGELAYPLALLGCVAAFLVMISTSLMPQLAALSDPGTWRGAGHILYEASRFTASWKGAALLAGVLLAAGLVILSLPRWTGRLRLLADRLPPWSIYRVLTGVGWLYATATLLQARDLKLGTITRRLVESKETAPYLRWRLRPVLEADSLGHTLGEALCASPDRWPDRAMADDLRVYSALPGFSGMLAGLAEELMDMCVERVRATSKILGGLAVLLVILVLCLLVLGLFGIQEQITGSVGSMGGL